MITEDDILQIRPIMSPLVGQRAWAAQVGYANNLTLEFGNALPPKAIGKSNRSYVRGEWHLWVQACEWRLEKDSAVIGGTSDDRAKLAIAALQLNGQTLTDFDLYLPALDVVFYFGTRVVLKLFAMTYEDIDSWHLFCPDHKVVVIGPRNRWWYGDSDQPRPE